MKHVDELMGTLEADLKATQLPVDLVIVSDHGMAKIQGGWIDLDQYAPMDGLTTVGDSLYAPTEQAANAAYQKLKAADAAFMVYQRAIRSRRNCTTTAIRAKAIRSSSREGRMPFARRLPPAAKKTGRPPSAITASIRT